jgi:hypothetical protein
MAKAVRVWEIDTTLIESFLDSLTGSDHAQVEAVLEMLETHGPQLGRPLADTVKGSEHSNMKELRPTSRDDCALRILFAFDPKRHAILLVAGDKSDDWKGWYRVNIPIANALYDEHVESLGK